MLIGSGLVEPSNSGNAATLTADKINKNIENNIRIAYFFKLFLISFLYKRFRDTKNKNPEKKDALLKVRKRQQ